MKFKIIFICFYLVLLLDIITTFIALYFFGFVEATPFPKYLFSLGIIGWLLAIIIDIILALFLATYMYYSQLFIAKKWGIYKAEIFPIVGIIIFNIAWVTAPINNLLLIIGKLIKLGILNI
jgi:hypothetical protein